MTAAARQHAAVARTGIATSALVPSANAGSPEEKRGALAVRGMSAPVAANGPTQGAPRSLLDIEGLGRDGIVEVLRLAESFAEVARRPIPKVPALRGRTVVSLFFEDSTRTRLSFETAARRLSADVMSFQASASSIKKGESLRDTALTFQAMGVDAIVVRHPSAGAPARVASWVDVPVVNAGDGWHAHPTQALADCFALCGALGRPPDGGAEMLAGIKAVIVGDIRHSRVARSVTQAFSLLGAAVTLAAPRSLLPPAPETWPVAEVSHDLDDAVRGADVVYVLRLQAERGAGAYVPSLREYSARYGITAARAASLAPEVRIMHPGPMVRGVEISSEAADLDRCLVDDQVRAGIAVRMAVLFLLLSSGDGASGAELGGHD